MMINPRRETSPETMKELKVSIPVRYHLQLHTLKVLEGRQIHAVVQEALNGYFQAMRDSGELATKPPEPEEPTAVAPPAAVNFNALLAKRAAPRAR